METKAFVLTSGGLDSATCLALAIEKYGKNNVETLSIFYGQTLSRELDSAAELAKYYDVKNTRIDLSEVFKKSKCSLIQNTGDAICKMTYEAQSDGIISSYVPFRNGVFLSVASSVALSRSQNAQCVVVLGNHGSDFSYADCSHDFVKKMNDAILEGTYGLVEFWSPLDGMTKAEVVAEGLKLGVPYELTWSCYEGGEKPCGACASCLCRIEAFRLNGRQDPLAY